MTIIGDGYDSYYAERLWLLLPGVYRADDSPGSTPGVATPRGPLRELVDRIGAQIAVTRRSIDRLWADQSIETCDDWVIAYIGDLLGTNLVNALDSRGQRLDVARTIHYRRRKGTVQVLTELAADITGWTAVVVEGFRRMARARHGLDPAVGAAAFPSIASGDIASFLETEGLVGPLTSTPVGGTLDLRNAHGATLVGSAFDESFHYADVRAGVAQVGRYTIPKLLVFLWRLQSFGVVAGTPVEYSPNCPQPTYTFDPTGRLTPLFLPTLPASQSQADYSEFVVGGVDQWAPYTELQVPGPLTTSLLESIQLQGGATSSMYQVFLGGTATDTTLLVPELGQFSVASTGPSEPTVSYYYGFPSQIGAGTYSREALPSSVTEGLPLAPTVNGGGTALSSAIEPAPMKGVVVLGDSLTYTSVSPVGATASPIVNFVLSAADETRPVIRPGPGTTEWVFTGGGQAVLVLDGLLITGLDVVLRGNFSSVTITGCTTDPGMTASPPAAPGDTPIANAVDGRPLAPVTIYIEADPSQPPGQGGAIGNLTISNSILGPIRTRYDGAVQSITVTDSILQALPTTNQATYTPSDIYDPLLLAEGLTSTAPLAASLLAKMSASSPTVGTDLGSIKAGSLASAEAPVPNSVLNGLNALVSDSTLVDSTTLPLFTSAVALGPSDSALFETVTQDVAAGQPSSLSSADQQSLNRALVDAVFPVALGLSALALASASVNLSRVTVIGPLYAHDLQLSDSIVTGVIGVDDVQQGCVRFSAIVPGNHLPSQYETVFIPEDAPLFTSDDYGQPGYCQLIDAVDDAILPPAQGSSTLSPTQGSSIRTGADTGSEMGAFCSDLNPLNEQALIIKYAEYMPLGLTPVLVHVT